MSGPGGGQEGQGLDPRLGSALEPGRLPPGRVELQAVVVEREYPADRGQAWPAGQGGQGGIDPAEVTGRRVVLQAVDVTRRDPGVRVRDGREGGPVDGAGEQRPAAGFVRGDVALRERRPLLELEDEDL